MTTHTWFHVFVGTFLTQFISGYPEYGLHLELNKAISVKGGMMTPINSWSHETVHKKGLFYDGISLSAGENFRIKKSGLYYISVNIAFNIPINRLVFLNIEYANKQGIQSKYEGEQPITSISLSDILMLDKNSILKVSVSTENDTQLAKHCRITIQYLTSYDNSIGFLASPVERKTIKTSLPQFLVNWRLIFSLRHDFQRVSGSFFFTKGGVYLVTFRFILETILGRVQFLLHQESTTHIMIDQYFHHPLKISTFTYTGFYKFRKHQKISLKLVTENSRSLVKSSSSYSIMLLKVAEPNQQGRMQQQQQQNKKVELPIQHSQLLHNDQQPAGQKQQSNSDQEIEDKNFQQGAKQPLNSQLQRQRHTDIRTYSLEKDFLITGKSVKIVSWNATNDDLFYTGKFHIETSGYYLVSLYFLTTPSSCTLSADLDVDLSKYSLENKQLQEGQTSSFTGLLYLRKGDVLSCFLHSRSPVKLSKSSIFSLFKINLQTFTALYTLNEFEKVQLSSNNKIQVKEFPNFYQIPTVNRDIITSRNSSNSISIRKSGLYFIVLNLPPINGSEIYELKLRKQNKDRIHKDITMCILSERTNCFVNLMLVLECGEFVVLKVSDLNTEEFLNIATGYFEITFLKPLSKLFGFSANFKTNAITDIKYSVDFSNLAEAKEKFQTFSTARYEQDTLEINKAGYYIVNCNLIINSSHEVTSLIVNLKRKREGLKDDQIAKVKKSVGQSYIQISVMGSSKFETGDFVSIEIIVKSKSIVLTWWLVEDSFLAVAHLTDSRKRYFSVEGLRRYPIQRTDGYPIQNTIGMIFKNSEDESQYFNFHHTTLRASESFTGLFLLTLVGKVGNVFNNVASSTFSSGGKLIHDQRTVRIALNDKQQWPYLTSTVNNVSSGDSIVLHVSGLVTLHTGDSITVNVEIPPGAKIDVETGSMMSLFVLENEVEDIDDSTVFFSKHIQPPNKNETTEIKPGSKFVKAGAYLLDIALLSFWKNETGQESVISIILRNSQRSRRGVNSSTDEKKNIDQIFQVKCSDCKDLTAVCYVYINKDNHLEIETKNFASDHINLRYKFLGASKNINTLHPDKDTFYDCNNLGDIEIADAWYCGDSEICKPQSYFYKSSKIQSVILNIQIFVRSESKNGFLQLQSNFKEGENITSTLVSEDLYYFHMTKQLFLMKSDLLKLRMFCGNDTTVTISKNSRIDIMSNDVISSSDTEKDFPIFTEDPSPKLITVPYKFNYTCAVDGIFENVSYRWNKIDLNSGVHIKNISNTNFMTIYGLPEESGHYYCVANTDVYETESQAVKLHISDDDECFLLTNESMRLEGNFSIDPCHENALCLNTIGSYKCKCKQGYSGDGFYCEDINECLEEDICGNFTRCENFKSGYNCLCLDGYKPVIGSMEHCKDIDECEEFGDEKCYEKMGANATYCHNTQGSFDCLCKEGYEEKDGKCVDVNECNNEVYPCHDYAHCINVLGSYYCQCYNGSVGNGTVCEDINECLNSTMFSCARNASCVNNYGSYRCICDSGFKGDGFRHCEAMGCFPPPFCYGRYIGSWWRRKPYIEHSHHKDAEGLFYDILSLLVTDICNNCSEILFESPLNGSMGVEEKVEKNITDFGCPLYGSKEQEKFRGFPFLPIVESPGVAFFVNTSNRKTSPLIGSLVGSWPILVITLILASLSGIIIWFLDTIRNPDEFPSSFIEGSWQGFWWAFITMTTVGYGDIAPRSFAARVFGVLWILIGLVIMSTFTATITTVLTTTSLTSQMKLYGTKVGALANSEEFRLGVKRNADIKGYNSVKDIIAAMDRDEIQGALIDSYIAGEYQEDLSRYKLQDILEHVFVYGVVLSRDAIKMEPYLREKIEKRQSEIYSVIAKVIKPLKALSKSHDPMASTSAFFDRKSEFFKTMFLGGGICLCILILIGLAWDLYWRKTQHIREKKKNDERHNGYLEMTEEDSFICLNSNSSTNVIEYQRKAYKTEITKLRKQITTFSELWVDRLNELEETHDSELGNVQSWLEKANLLSTKHQEKHTFFTSLCGAKNKEVSV